MNPPKPLPSPLNVIQAHSTASILSLQGAAPLHGHPKTLRDLTHTSELLTLPPSFGSIQLGETFACCLCVNNETTAPGEEVVLKVEMQTATTKVLLGEFGGSGHILAAMDTMQCVVNHEIKELGQHVLACSVSYRSPTTRTTNAFDETSDSCLLTFRKFYKFAVSITMLIA